MEFLPNITGYRNSKKIYECIKATSNCYNFHARIKDSFLVKQSNILFMIKHVWELYQELVFASCIHLVDTFQIKIELIRKMEFNVRCTKNQN